MNGKDIESKVTNVFSMQPADLFVVQRPELILKPEIGEKILYRYRGIIPSLMSIAKAIEASQPSGDSKLQRHDLGTKNNLQAEIRAIIIARIYPDLEKHLKDTRQDRIRDCLLLEPEAQLGRWSELQESTCDKYLRAWFQAKMKQLPLKIQELCRLHAAMLISENEEIAKIPVQVLKLQEKKKAMDDPSHLMADDIVKGLGTAREITWQAFIKALSTSENMNPLTIVRIQRIIAILRSQAIIAYLLAHLPQSVIVDITEDQILERIVTIHEPRPNQFQATLNEDRLEEYLYELLNKYQSGQSSKNPRHLATTYNHQIRRCPALFSKYGGTGNNALMAYYRLCCDEIELIIHGAYDSAASR